ncbi:hypothetical protein [Marinomonas fungiae]|uniref:Uncharacterized protein n=1 Tax=Marinomonas fungiae TaxID=1137284 RepID=A0A0K6IS72_9GAMM|nr:hypothetical protein [Marinomonas fungiae]CUB05956.1 hypothetical protein Ga0061065_11415 [Marinomonas fungiae]
MDSANNKLYKEKPTLYNLIDGELEKILKRKPRDEARKALVWGNLFYGAKNRKSVSIKTISSSEVAVKDRHWYEEVIKGFNIEDYIKP